MPAFRLSALPLKKWTPQSFQVELTISDEVPAQKFEAKSVEECRNELHRYAEELKKTGKPWMVSVCHIAGSGRKPNGFDRADLHCFVNKELVAAT